MENSASTFPCFDPNIDDRWKISPLYKGVRQDHSGKWAKMNLNKLPTLAKIHQGIDKALINYFGNGQYKDELEINSDIKQKLINLFKTENIRFYPHGIATNEYFEFFYQIENNSFVSLPDEIIISSKDGDDFFVFSKPSFLGNMALIAVNSYIYSEESIFVTYSVKFQTTFPNINTILQNIVLSINQHLEPIGCFLKNESAFSNSKDNFPDPDFEFVEQKCDAFANLTVERKNLTDDDLLRLLNNSYKVPRINRFMSYFKILERATGKTRSKTPSESIFSGYYKKKELAFKNAVVDSEADQNSYDEYIEFIRTLRNLMAHNNEQARNSYTKVKHFSMTSTIVFLERLIENEIGVIIRA